MFLCSGIFGFGLRISRDRFDQQGGTFKWGVVTQAERRARIGKHPRPGAGKRNQRTDRIDGTTHRATRKNIFDRLQMSKRFTSARHGLGQLPTAMIGVEHKRTDLLMTDARYAQHVCEKRLNELATDPAAGVKALVTPALRNTTEGDGGTRITIRSASFG